MKTINDPGFGYSSKKDAKSYINKDGSSNIIHLNKKFSFQETYTHLIQISWLQFFLFVFISFIIINSIFSLIYVIVKVDEVTLNTGNFFSNFLNGFFFSAQTITTVGYGKVAPSGLFGNIISTFEALTGLLSFSFITGLLYGRFSKPTASIAFSKNIILRDFNDGKAIMFRLQNNRKTIMIEPEVSVTFSKTVPNKNNDLKREFYQLPLQFDKIKYLPTTWTIVHEITEDSPFYNLTSEEILELDAEWYILIQYHDDSFAQRVYQIYSYNIKDLKVDVRFVPSTSFNGEGFTVLDHHLLSTVENFKTNALKT